MERDNEAVAVWKAVTVPAVLIGQHHLDNIAAEKSE
jgi:hypothetical protein